MIYTYLQILCCLSGHIIISILEVTNTIYSKDRNIQGKKESNYDRVNLQLLKTTVQRQLQWRKYKLCKFWMKIEYLHCHTTSIGFQLQLLIILHFILWLQYLNNKKTLQLLCDSFWVGIPSNIWTLILLLSSFPYFIYNTSGFLVLFTILMT